MVAESFIHIPAQDFNYGAYPVLLKGALESYRLRPLKGPAFQVSVKERAFAIPVCILAAFQIEAILGYVDYKKSPDDKLADREKLLSNVLDLGLRDFIKEVWVVRDAVAHSHLHQTKIEYDDSLVLRKSRNTKLRGGNALYKKIVSRNKTNALKMNVLPSKICFTDALVSIKVADLVSRHFGNGGHTKFYVHEYGTKIKSVDLDGFIEDLMLSVQPNRRRLVMNRLEPLKKHEQTTVS